MNEGLFVGTHGWVLKPEHMRKKRGLSFDDGVHALSAPPPRMMLKGHIVGVSASKCCLASFPPESSGGYLSDVSLYLVPAPNGRTGKTFHAYVRAELFYHREVTPPTPAGEDGVAAAAKSTSLESIHLRWKSKSIKVQHHAQDGADGVWNEIWGWEYEKDELAFIR